MKISRSRSKLEFNALTVRCDQTVLALQVDSSALAIVGLLAFLGDLDGEAVAEVLGVVLLDVALGIVCFCRRQGKKRRQLPQSC